MLSPTWGLTTIVLPLHSVSVIVPLVVTVIWIAEPGRWVGVALLIKKQSQICPGATVRGVGGTLPLIGHRAKKLICPGRPVPVRLINL